MALFTTVLFWVVWPAFEVLGLCHCGKSPFFNPEATGLVLQTKWREVSLGLAKSPGSAPTDWPVGAIFLLLELQKSFLKPF